jgi:xanthine dehydrogenase small subunit
MTLPNLELLHRNRWHTLSNVPPARTLLDLLREDLRATDTKEGCASGDCGACTVVLGSGEQAHTVNSCIRMAHSAHGLQVTTASDLSASGPLHPVQQALVDHHASQCGFCTPGFVMSLYDLYNRAQGQAVSRDEAMEAISGNLCRCTGYRPILDAAMAMHLYPSPKPALAAPAPESANQRDPLNAHYALPTSLRQLLPLRARFPQAQIMAGGTDAALWVTQQHKSFEQVIDLTPVAELRRIEYHEHHIAIGAAVSIHDAFAALSKRRPSVTSFAHRFAGRPVRQSGTLGGNVANGSPIGDSMPLLIALGAQVVLMAWRNGRMVHRHVPLEDYYIGYRQTVLAPDELLCWIVVPHPTADEKLHCFKVSKRIEDDISSVCLVLNMHLQQEHIDQVRIGVGGVAATPVRALQTEAVLRGQALSQASLAKAQDTLAHEFNPISDMRASAEYRRLLLRNLLQRAWLLSVSQDISRLEDLT